MCGSVTERRRKDEDERERETGFAVSRNKVLGER